MSPSAKGGHGASEAAIIGGQDSSFGAVFNGHPALVQRQKCTLESWLARSNCALHKRRNREYFWAQPAAPRGTKTGQIGFIRQRGRLTSFSKREGNHAKTPSLSCRCGHDDIGGASFSARRSHWSSWSARRAGSHRGRHRRR